MNDFGFRMKVMLICIGSWILSSAVLLIIFALADLQTWCAVVAIMFPGAIYVPLGLHAISKHEEVQPMNEVQESQPIQEATDEQPEGYVRLFCGSPIPKDINGTFYVYSELFDTFSEAAQFADVFQHNYYTPGIVRETPEGKFFVECKNAERRMLGTEFIENQNTCLVENIKNPYRGPKKAAVYFDLKKRDKELKDVRYAVYAIIWIVALILIFTSKQRSLAAFIVVPMAVILCFSYTSGYKRKRRCSYSWSYIDQMGGVTFERFVGNLIVQNKYGAVKYTPATGDFGVDIILNGRTAIQCKRSAKSLGIKPVQEVYTGMSHYGCDEAIVVTNASFTKNAVQLANELNVTLWDRDTLKGMM